MSAPTDVLPQEKTGQLVAIRPFDPYWTGYQSKMLVLCVSIDIGLTGAATIDSRSCFGSDEATIDSEASYFRSGARFGSGEATTIDSRACFGSGEAATIDSRACFGSGEAATIDSEATIIGSTRAVRIRRRRILAGARIQGGRGRCAASALRAASGNCAASARRATCALDPTRSRGATRA
jgi:hypothetical protein